MIRRKMMKNKFGKRIVLVSAVTVLTAAMLAGCTGLVETSSQKPSEEPKETVELPGKLGKGGDGTEEGSEEVVIERNFTAESTSGSAISCVFLTQEDASIEITASPAYYQNMNQRSIDFRMGKSNSTPEELRDFAKSQTREFDANEVEDLKAAFQRIQDKFDRLGFKYPIDFPIQVAKTTMAEEGDEYFCYERGNTVYVGEGFNQEYDLTNPADAEQFDYLLVKALFHVITTNNRDFKENMYRICGFTLTSEPFFDPAVDQQLYKAPDVEAYDAYAQLTVNGKKVDAIIVSYLPEYTDGASIGDSLEVGVVAVGDLTKITNEENVSDFYITVGNNVGFVSSIEECMADNFALAVCYQNELFYSTPAIINEILSYCSTGTPTKKVTQFLPEATITIKQ